MTRPVRHRTCGARVPRRSSKRHPVHRVFLFLGWLLRAAGTLHAWPDDFAEAFKQAERTPLRGLHPTGRAREPASRNNECCRCPTPFCRRPAVALTHYPSPHIRPRADTDLLCPSEKWRARSRRRASGIRSGRRNVRAARLYQSHYRRTDRHGVTHALDVHWKIEFSGARRHRLTHAELWSAASPSSPRSRPYCHAARALLLGASSIAPAIIPGSSESSCGLYHFHLLGSCLTADQNQQFQAVVAERGLQRASRPKASQSRDGLFGDPTLDAPVEATCSAPANGDGSVRPGLRPRYCVSYLQALPDWRTRGRLLREHLLPSSNYMRARYGVPVERRASRAVHLACSSRRAEMASSSRRRRVTR